MDQSSTFRDAMRFLAGGVSIITTRSQAMGRSGLTATSVCSLSDDPPSLLVCVNRHAGAHGIITAERRFAVNILDKSHIHLAARFSGRDGIDGDARFAADDDDWRTLSTGAPVLKDALAYFDCMLGGYYEYKTHTVFIGAVVEAGNGAGALPLIYFNRDYATARPTVDICGQHDTRANVA